MFWTNQVQIEITVMNIFEMVTLGINSFCLYTKILLQYLQKWEQNETRQVIANV